MSIFIFTNENIAYFYKVPKKQNKTTLLEETDLLTFHFNVCWIIVFKVYFYHLPRSFAASFKAL